MCDITHDLQIPSPITNCHDNGLQWSMTYFMDDLQVVIRSITEDQERETYRQTESDRDRERDGGMERLRRSLHVQ